MALSDAKGDVDDRVRDLAASERELEKADFDLRYKTHEAKLVNKAAVAKRTEVGEVHNCCHAAVCHVCCAAVCYACSSAAGKCQLTLKSPREYGKTLGLCMLQHSFKWSTCGLMLYVMRAAALHLRNSCCTQHVTSS